MPRVVLRREARGLVERGMLTIYSRWIEDRGAASPGSFVDVYLGDECIGSGFLEDVGAIGVRLLTYRCGAHLEDVLGERLEEALKRRQKLGWDSYRLINADGDMLPGLIIDVYRDLVVIQSSSLGFDRNLGLLVRWIRRNLSPRTIYLKNDQRSRREAGLPLDRRVLYGSSDARAVIKEGKARFLVDAERGQKTGFFLDQRVNRLFLADIAWEGARLLDLYSYTGGFAIQGLLGGASKAVLVEESPIAVDIARRNLEMNGVAGRAEIVRGRVEEYLSSAKTEFFDIVVADPPALIQSRANKEAGIRAYRSLYVNAMRLVRDGGLLVASSCSYFLSWDDLMNILIDAADRNSASIRVIWRHGAGPDHVFRPQDSFLDYLKTVVVIVERGG